MARPLRIAFPGAFYHVYSRGIARDPILGSDRERRIFLGILGKVVDRHKVKVHCYCLMGNHYHLLLETPEGNLSAAMRQLHGVYGQSYNRLLKRPGPVFQGRFKACVVDENAYLLSVCRYIVLNPVRAGMVQRADQWKWSSHRAMAGLSPTPDWLTRDTLYGVLGRGSVKQAIQRYRDFITEEEGEGDRELEGGMRKVVLGTDMFRHRMSDLLKGKRNQTEVPKHQRFTGRPELAQLLSGPLTKKARNRRILKAIVEHGYTQKAIAEHLDLHYATISRIVKNEEKSKYKT